MAVVNGILVTEAATPPISASKKKRDAHYLRIALAISATVYLGFWFTYFGPQIAGTYPQAALTVHLHGWSFFAWYLLFPVQAALIHTRRVRLHRTLGSLSVALTTVMAATGLLVIGVRMEAALASSQPSFWSLFGPMIFATLVLFTGFYTAALVLRRQSAYHKRLLIVASAAGMGAAAFRIIGATFGPVIWAAPLGILATNLFIVWGMVYDHLREERVHRAYRIGLLVCVGVELGVWMLTPTPVGQGIAHGLAWVGRTLGFLY
jgi:hypothetical protein